MARGKALWAFDDYREMLADTLRLDAYRRALNATVQPGDVVLDLGAGTGILGFLALRAGAGHVHAVEAGPAVDLLRAVAERNGLSDRVTVHACSSLDADLPRCDLLVSETLGSWAVDENTLPYVIDARERLLKPGAPLIPDRLELFLAPAESPEITARRVTFWDDVAGLDFSPAAEAASRRLAVETVRPDELLAAPAHVASLDLRTVTSPLVQVQHRFVHRRAGTLHGLVGWFQAGLADDIVIDTAPGQPSTHWEQAWLPLERRVEVGPCDILDVRLALGPGERPDDTRLQLDWFQSQIGLPLHQRLMLPCPCGRGLPFQHCCGKP